MNKEFKIEIYFNSQFTVHNSQFKRGGPSVVKINTAILRMTSCSDYTVIKQFTYRKFATLEADCYPL